MLHLTKLHNTSQPDKYYVQAFVNANSVTVNHNLEKNPAITVMDSAGTEFICDVEHLSVNQCLVSWIGLLTGSVTCN